MKLRFITLVILATLVVSGCRKTATAPPPAGPPNAPTSLPELTQAQGGTTPAPAVKYFKGSIGSSLDLQMKLVRADPQLSGSYYYQRIGTHINLRGTIDPDGKFVLDEFDSAGKQTGVFKGIWTLDAQDGAVKLAGFWAKVGTNDKESDKTAAFSLHEEPIALSGDAELSSKQIKESNKKSRYEIAAQYPQLSGGSNPNFEKFNQAARGVVARKVADFKKQVAAQEGVESVPDVNATPEPTPEPSSGSDLTVEYEIALAQDDLISIEFNVSEYYQGAAHPNSYSEVINYDLKNGRQLKLSDLFKPGSKYLQTLSSYAIADLKKQSKAKGDALVDADIQTGAGPKPENYDKWTITKNGVGIDFGAYQVGPYAAGPWSVVVPYANLKDLINPDVPIAQITK